MSVKAKRKVSGVGRVEFAVSAADLLKDEHPLRKAFVKWCGDKDATKRQAAKFLQAHPQYKEAQDA